VGSPYSQHGILYQARGEPQSLQYLETFRAGADPGSELSHLVLACHCSAKPERPRPGEVWTWAAMDSGTRITGGGSGYAALLAHAGGALYGTELGSVTLKRMGFFCFPNKHSTHTGTFFWRTQKESCKGLVSVTLKINSQHTPQ